MPRVLWKGAISFGLVNIPVGLYPAEKKKELSFSMLDKRNLAPVGYKRVNKETGKEVPWEQVVKGYEYEKDRYVILTDEELDSLPVTTAKAIEIERFVEAEEIDPIYFQKAYYLVPEGTGVKAYHLLREAMADDGKIALAKVAFRDKEHLATLRLRDNVFVLETKHFHAGLKITEEGEFLRWNDFRKTYEGMPSPFAQNDRHIAVLRDAFKQIDMPKRLGVRLSSTYRTG